MKVTVMPIIIVALITDTKGLKRGLEDLEIKGRVDTIQTTALLRSNHEKSFRLDCLFVSLGFAAYQTL